MPHLIKDSRILITGGAGFIGANLVEALLAQGNEVVCLDNLSSGYRRNIEMHASNRSFTFIEGDIRDAALCRKACEGVGYVLHHAAVCSVPQSIEDPILSADVNIMGFLQILQAARDARVRRFIYAASSAAYGDNTRLPQVEDEIGRPLSPYAVTKYTNELLALNFSDLYGMETVGLRYFNVFGRRQDPGGAYAAVIPCFAKALIDHESPVINGDGSYSRDFTHVENVILINQLAALTARPDAVNTVYNVACGERTSLNELFQVLREQLARFDARIAGIEPIHGPVRTGDIPHSQASIDRARERLGFHPSHSFREGIAETAEWYFRNL